MGSREGWDKNKTVRQLRQIQRFSRMAMNHSETIQTPGLALDDEIIRTMRRAYTLASRQLERLGHPEAEPTTNAI